MSITKKVSLVTITYNSDKTIFNLLRSLKFINKLIKEIIVIDNNSDEINIKKIESLSKKIKVIINKKNYGFAKAVNQGIKKSKSDFILLLNPDAYLEDNSLEKTFELIYNDEKIGAIGGKIFNQKNERMYTATMHPNFMTALFEFTNLKKIFPNNKYSKKFWVEKDRKINSPIDVTSLCGAYMFIRKKINNHLNLFNEKFFLYLEDIDFGIKLNNLGYKVIFDPNSKIKHIGGASNNNKYRTDLKSWYASRKLFFRLHQNRINGIILSAIFKIEEKLLTAIHILKNDPTS